MVHKELSTSNPRLLEPISRCRIKIIERTEHKLSAIAKEVAKEVKELEKPE
jgi:hypothetical protein